MADSDPVLLTRNSAERIAAVVRRVERSAPVGRLRRRRDGAGHSRRFFPAFLTGYELVSVNRYRYSWVEAESTPGGSWVQKENGLSSTVDSDDFAVPAFNAMECTNDGTDLESGGVNVDGGDYPGGFHLQPIRGGAWTTSTDPDPGTSGSWTLTFAPGVFLFPMPGSDFDGINYFFSAMNAHDGLCSAPLAAAAQATACRSGLFEAWKWA